MVRNITSIVVVQQEGDIETLHNAGVNKDGCKRLHIKLYLLGMNE